MADITGMTRDGKEVEPNAPGAVYQVVKGDPSNEQFVKALRDGARREDEEMRLVAQRSVGNGNSRSY